MAMKGQIEIREANDRYLDAIAHILVDAWRTTFRGRLSDEFLDGLTYAGQRERHQRTMADPTTAYFVAVCPQTHEVIGFANGGPNRHSEYPYASELYAIYILDEFQRRGTGRALFCALASRLLQSGSESMLVWVLRMNPNHGFYESLGAREFARRQISLGPDTVDEIAFAWSDLRSTLRSIGAK